MLGDLALQSLTALSASNDGGVACVCGGRVGCDGECERFVSPKA
jgi:hypothetical protein